MRIILNEADTERTLDRLEELLEQVRDQHRALRRRHLDENDGHRRRASGSEPSSPSNELDDDGTPLPPRSDPTATIVIDRNEPTDDLGTTLATIVGKINEMKRTAEAIISDAAQVRPPIKANNTDDIWCTNCKKHGVHEPREEGRQLCRWCRRELTEQKKLPSRRLVLAHARDARITPKLRAEIAERDKEARAKRKQAKRLAKANVR